MTRLHTRAQAAFARRDHMLSDELLADLEAFGRDLAAHRRAVDAAAANLASIDGRVAAITRATLPDGDEK